MSKKQYSPRKQKREKAKVAGDHSKIPDKTPEVKKEGDKVEKKVIDEILPSVWSDWQWVSEGWYYYRARRGENGKWQYEFEIPETTGPQAESPASTPAAEETSKSDDNSVKPVETATQSFPPTTESDSYKNTGDAGCAGSVNGPICNWSFVPYTEGFVDNKQQTTPPSTTEALSKPSNQVVEDSKEVKKEVKEPAAENLEEKSAKVVRRERGRGRGRRKDLVTEWREGVAKETKPKSSEGEADEPAPKPKKRREKDRHRDRSYYNKPPYSDYYTLSE